MEFRRLRLAGFKSFVEPAELRIEPGLTGVVGPNGCGKSNLLEALRWVMGEGSPKSMRSGGMDDVIFAGTGQRPPRSFAQVTLGLAGAAGEEIEVSRRIERGAGSDYRINGRDSRAQDVRLLFADSATGAHSPAIVGQGRISSIIAAKPAERRALLEEAAGIAGLHVRRREAEIRLRAAEANLSRLDDVVKGLESQIGGLKRQARVAERYRALSDQIKAGEAALTWARWLAAREAAQAAQAAVKTAEAVADERTRAAAALAADAADATAALPALRQAEAEAAAAVQAVRQARALLDAEAASARTRDQALAGQLATIARDAAREAGLAEDAAAAEARLVQEADALTAARAAAEAALPALKQAAAEASAEAAIAEAALAAALDAHAAAAAEARSRAEAARAAAARLARLEAEQRDLEARRTRLAVPPETAALAEAVTATQAGLAEAETALAEAEAARPEADAAREQASAAQAAARATLAGLKAEAEALGRRLAADQAKGPRIAEMIETDAGYEQALAAALGDELEAGPAASNAPRRWAGSAGAGDPALPEGAAPLAAHVRAPAELARRLVQIGVVAAADGEALAVHLAPGQRLVSLEGRLWRWDGYREAGGRAEAAAARLRARRRAGEVAAEAARAEATLNEASAALAGAVEAAGKAQAAERAARAGREQVARALADARARLAAAEQAAARLAGEAASLGTAAERLAAERERLSAEVAEAEAALPGEAALADLSELLARARAAATAARTAAADAQATSAARQRDSEAASTRLAAIGQERQRWLARLAASSGQAEELAARRGAVEAERTALAARGAAIVTEIAGLASRVSDLETVRTAAADALAAADAEAARLAAAARAADAAVAEARERRATTRAEAEHQAAAQAEVERGCGERFGCSPPMLPGRFGFAPDSVAAADVPALAESHEALLAERERLGPVNLRADIELQELTVQAETVVSEKAELETAIARLRGSIGSLNREGRARLAAAFEAVNGHFQTLFTDLFGGGEARLALIDAEDPLEAGLEIMAQPPGKKLQSLTLLSGGEQALTATALIFALFLANPSPICVLDEVDAPLDDANVERFCDLLDRMAAATATRFLIVTHNAVSMSRMHRLYGVTMGEPGVSQLVSVDLQAAERLLAVA
ncbi:chromosome segregation SMC family protein [Polymorphobacter sp.]|uniref:chromosome segregation SMC family protein n=1 Tax=Polymorphobacter sp. TaxID=1909290 RepID=UPI003F714F5C